MGPNKADVIGVTVAVLLHRLPFPIHQYRPHRMGHGFHQILQNLIKRHS